MANALQDVNSSRHAEPRTGDEKGVACGVEAASSRNTAECGKAGECGSLLRPGSSEDRHMVFKGINELPTNLTENQVLNRGYLEETATKDHGNSSAVKIKNKKNRAKKNREQVVKRLKLQPVQKPKTISHCRHYLKGRCHEGDKCQFSHDAVPLTKSKSCFHFARHSCMKGDDCRFDDQLSNYPCTNFVSKGSCNRGDACTFSHKV